jgi:hypothetical protein
MYRSVPGFIYITPGNPEADARQQLLWFKIGIIEVLLSRNIDRKLTARRQEQQGKPLLIRGANTN